MLDESFTYLVVNIVIYIILAFWARKYTKVWGATFAVYVFYALSAVATILFYYHPYTEGTTFFRPILLAPLLFYAAMTFIITYPLTKLDRMMPGAPVFVVNENLIVWYLTGIFFVQIIIYLSFFSFFMTIWDAPDLSMMRTDNANGDTNPTQMVNGLVAKLFVYYNWLRNVSVVIAIYALFFVKKYRKLVIIASISTLFYPMYYSMLYIMRSQIYLQIVTLIFFFWVYRRFVTKAMRKALFWIGGVFLTFALSSVILVSNGRFGELVTWMYYRYMGESFVNFSSMLWVDQVDTANGMAYFKWLLTGQDYESMFEKWQAIEYATGVDPHVFNTSVGQLMLDFGTTSTVFIYIAIAFVMWYLFKKQPGITMSGMLCVGFISQFLFYGFYVFPFQSSAILQVPIYFIAIFYFSTHQQPLEEEREEEDDEGAPRQIEGSGGDTPENAAHTI